MQRDIILVLGRTGYGKTQWARQYIRGLSRLFLFDAMSEYPLAFNDHQSLIEKYDNGEFALSRSFREATNDQNSIDLLGALSILSQNCTLVIEECSLVFPSRQAMPAWTRDIVFMGRHRGVSLLATAQRPMSIPVDLRSQASRIVTFGMHEFQDVHWLKDFYGPRVKDLPHLPPMTCLDAGPEGISEYQIPLTTD